MLICKLSKFLKQFPQDFITYMYIPILYLNPNKAHRFVCIIFCAARYILKHNCWPWGEQCQVSFIPSFVVWFSLWLCFRKLTPSHQSRSRTWSIWWQQEGKKLCVCVCRMLNYHLNPALWKHRCFFSGNSFLMMIIISWSSNAVRKIESVPTTKKSQLVWGSNKQQEVPRSLCVEMISSLVVV